VPAARHLVFGLGLDSFWARHAHGSNITEISNYLGLLTFALAIGWLVVVYRRRVALRQTRLPEVTAGLVTAFVVGFLFALPSPVGGMSMPSKWLWDRISAFRVPSRWDPLLMTVLLPLAALALQALWRALARRGRLVAVAAVAAAIAISFAELAVHTVPRFRTVPVPAEYVALKTTTPNGILAEYPLGYSDIYRLWQRVHDRPLVNGAPDGTPADQMRMVLLDPAQPGTAQSLALLGVTAIAIHPGGPADVPVEPREPTDVPGYRLVGRYPDTASIWDVVARPAPALVVPAGGFLAPTRTGNGPLEFALVSSPGSLELRAKTPAVVNVTFDATVQGGGSTTLHLGDGSRDVAVPVSGTSPVSVAVQVPRGRSEIFLRPEGSAQLSTSLPRAHPTGANAALSALPLSSDPGF
jgi:hypothetical protein